MAGLPVQLHLQRQRIFIILTSAGVLAKFQAYPLSLLHSRAVISAGGSPCTICNSTNQELNLYWCCLPGLAASTTQQFLTPLTSLCYQFLKSDQLGTTRKIPSPPGPRKFFARFGEKWMGDRELLNGCPLPARTMKALWPFLAEQQEEAEPWDASALLPDRQVCSKPARFQEGHSREHSCQGGEGCTACFLVCARDCFIALGGCQPHTKDTASLTSLFLPHPTSPP